ncbi:efflux transporter outer membrane subunit [Consotaella salsifontis]|uniref:Efflux transporter, outer membrane factor (OMF) lipoprotein, NodT family n=1 Tax=Consotaella salsifontis TaxID=1365950 RepID=A0A1T4RKY1_9HYPH|nr:efflux transporter outer membrane subunit [Consotaella salsifontis]SKA16436.1 efflux transporter, outer membrane factor (OMF) lipoprotein, NodT family [Consotaella salsifontis]
MIVRRFAPPLLASALVSGCMVGPDYLGPPNAAPRASAATAFLRADRTTPAYHPADDWWKAFDDRVLTDLVETAFANSPSIDMAQARLRQARAAYAGSRANLRPQGSASAVAAQARLGLGDTDSINDGLRSAASAAEDLTGLPVEAPSVPNHVSTDLYNAAFDASWEIDIFGGNRRAAEQSAAQAEAAEAALADAQVQLAAETAQAYVSLRSSQQQLAIARHSAELQQTSLNLTRQQAEQGTASDLDIARLETQLATTKADVPVLESEVEQGLNRLAVLCGLEPGELDARLKSPRSVPRPPHKVAIGDPAEMLRRRPDIRQAERKLAAGNAAIGQAVAQYFPKITLIGLASSGSTDADKLFDAGSLTLLGGPTLQWNVLSFGRTAARVEQAQAGFDAALAQYRQSVLSALEDAESSLSEFRHRQQNVSHLAEADAAASKAAELMRQMQEAGTVSVIDVLDVERQRLQAERGLAQGQAQLTNAFIALEKSLGLGWRPLLAPPPPEPKLALR